ncbi:LexA family protein [Brevibacillus sp. B_LB10_24]|uniref:LexA family protein n=1 Tax=Brevibacillus sp. B_LB10_24 TaxID=3380645 RepID=UPI0038B86255
MNYYQLVREYIAASGLSHREISKQCKERGTSVSQAYISQIAKGDVPPASDEVNRAIAAVTGGDPDALIIAGYREKAPLVIREMLDQADNITALIGRHIDALVEAMCDEYGCLDPLYRQLLQNALQDHEIVTDEDHLLKYDYQAKLLLKSLDIETRLKIFTLIVESLPYAGRKPDKLSGIPAEELSRLSRSRDFLRVPVVSQIDANHPRLIREEAIDTWVEMSNPYNYQDGDLFYLSVQDDSMAGSRICSGDKVLVKVQSVVESDDIAAVIHAGEVLLRRIRHADGGLVLLYPDNPRFKPLVIDESQLRICGKVIQVSFEPNTSN